MITETLHLLGTLEKMECEFASRERSSEEEAELQHSTKKVKKDRALGSAQDGRERGAGASGHRHTRPSW